MSSRGKAGAGAGAVTERGAQATTASGATSGRPRNAMNEIARTVSQGARAAMAKAAQLAGVGPARVNSQKEALRILDQEIAKTQAQITRLALHNATHATTGAARAAWQQKAVDSATKTIDRQMAQLQQQRAQIASGGKARTAINQQGSRADTAVKAYNRAQNPAGKATKLIGGPGTVWTRGGKGAGQQQTQAQQIAALQNAATTARSRKKGG